MVIRQVNIGPFGAQPNLLSPVRDLKHIGYRFGRRFNLQLIWTMADLRAHLLAHSRAHNRRFLCTIFENTRRRRVGGATGCLGPGSRRVAGGNRYFVRRNNAFGFNAVLQWFRQRKLHYPANVLYRRVVNTKLPAQMRQRTYYTAWPYTCP